MQKGFMYLVVVMDWFSRRTLAWRLSNTLTTGFCIEALHAAFAAFGAPEIFNTDQGSQFTSAEFQKSLTDKNVRISMDGRRRALDNVFIERFWRSVKYEDIYLNCYVDGHGLYKGLKLYFDYYDHRRSHQGLYGYTPAEVYNTPAGYLLRKNRALLPMEIAAVGSADCGTTRAPLLTASRLP